VTAQSTERARSVEKFTYRVFTLATGNKAWKHARIGIDLSTGKLEPMHAESDLLDIGVADETVDATSADKDLNVNLEREVIAQWMANGTAGDAVASTDVGKICYALDDQTVSILPIGKSIAGRVWAVSSTRGVLVERLPIADLNRAVVVAATAFASNDSIIPADPVSGAVYDVPTTAAASTVTLPASAPDGTTLYFAADGTKNGHTVQYRDATGPTNLTTALTASKRHLVVCIAQGGKWFANAYVSP
jgi:hypothetical protein